MDIIPTWIPILERFLDHRLSPRLFELGIIFNPDECGIKELHVCLRVQLLIVARVPIFHCLASCLIVLLLEAETPQEYAGSDGSI